MRDRDKSPLRILRDALHEIRWHDRPADAAEMGLSLRGERILCAAIWHLLEAHVGPLAA